MTTIPSPLPKIIILRPDLLNVLLLEPGGSKFFCFQKFDHLIECTHARDFVTDGSFEFVAQREVVSGCTVLLFPGGIFWQFIVKVRGGQVLRESEKEENNWSCTFRLQIFIISQPHSQTSLAGPT